MRHALVALGISSLSVACGGRVVLGDLPDDGGANHGAIDAGRPEASSDSDAAGPDAAGSAEAGPDDAGPDDGASDDGGSDDGGWIATDGGWSSDDGGWIATDGGWAFDGSFEDGSTSSCSLVGTWDATSNVPFGDLSSFLFSSDGTFIGGPRSALLPTGETFSGDWSIAADGEVSISNTPAMLCNAGPTNMSLTYGADCASVTLQVVTDACTGSREQLDDTTVLARR